MTPPEQTSTSPWRLTLEKCAERVQLNRERAVFPQYTIDGTWRLTDPSDARPGFMPEEAAWTSGFWPGMLWIASAVLDDEELATRAAELSAVLRPRAKDDRTHDLGFVFMPSSVLGWAVTGKQMLLEPAFEAADTLVRRWDARGGYLRAWGQAGTTGHAGITTIDAMMNVAFVMAMALARGDVRAAGLALTHAHHAASNQVRPDGSTFQVAEYDPVTGAFIRGRTHQGRSPTSCWSRGQAWAIYGFALMASLSGERRFADVATQASEYYMEHLLPDGMAPWDFTDPGDTRSTIDSSSMAIAAAGLLCLAQSTGDETGRAAALRLLTALEARAFIRDPGDALLRGGTFSLPLKVGVNESLIFGDFYFMDALSRASGMPYADYLRPAR